MDPDRPIDHQIRQINSMSRQRCVYELTHFEEIPLDFSPEDLDAMSLERLRHTLLAAVVTVWKRPQRSTVRAGGDTEPR